MDNDGQCRTAFQLISRVLIFLRVCLTECVTDAVQSDPSAVGVPTIFLGMTSGIKSLAVMLNHVMIGYITLVP